MSEGANALRIEKQLKVICFHCGARAFGDPRMVAMAARLTQGSQHLLDELSTPIGDARLLEPVDGAKLYEPPKCIHENQEWTPILRLFWKGTICGEQWLPHTYCEACTAIYDHAAFERNLSPFVAAEQLPAGGELKEIHWRITWVRMRDLKKVMGTQHREQARVAGRVGARG